MIWENNVNMIVMLCELENEKKEECIPYWDQIYQNSRHSVVVEKIESTKTPVKGIIHRVIHLKKRATGLSGSGSMIVDHFQMETWKDDCAIQENSEQLLALNYLLAKTFENKRIYPDQPILTHCSAGIGRTGTFLAICLMIEGVKEL